jgi:hypothetical protein
MRSQTKKEKMKTMTKEFEYIQALMCPITGRVWLNTHLGGIPEAWCDLNDMGQVGWELIQVVAYDPDTDMGTGMFKREKEDWNQVAQDIEAWKLDRYGTPPPPEVTPVSLPPNWPPGQGPQPAPGQGTPATEKPQEGQTVNILGGSPKARPPLTLMKLEEPTNPDQWGEPLGAGKDKEE